MIVYTANFDGYDFLNPPIHRQLLPPKNVRFVRFLDKDVPYNYQGWENIVFKPEHGTSIYTMKWLKLFPHRIFDDHEYIWMDANCMMRWDPWDIWNNVMTSPKYDVGFYCHPFLDSIYDEMKRVINWDVEDPERVKAMMSEYRRIGVPNYAGMFAATTVFLRKQGSALDDFSSLWWNEIMRWHARDQCSLAYVVYKLQYDVNIKRMPRHESAFTVDRFSYFGHAARQRWDWRKIKRYPDPRILETAEKLHLESRMPWHERIPHKIKHWCRSHWG